MKPKVARYENIIMQYLITLYTKLKIKHSNHNSKKNQETLINKCKDQQSIKFYKSYKTRYK